MSWSYLWQSPPHLPPSINRVDTGRSFLPVSSSLPPSLEALCAPGMPELNASLCCARGQQAAALGRGGWG